MLVLEEKHRKEGDRLAVASGLWREEGQTNSFSHARDSMTSFQH
jgi:hypothetical protein